METLARTRSGDADGAGADRGVPERQDGLNPTASWRASSTSRAGPQMDGKDTPPIVSDEGTEITCSTYYAALREVGS